MAGTTPTWRAREAAAQPRGVPLDPRREPVPGVQAFTTEYAPGHLIISGDPAGALDALRSAAIEFGWGVEEESLMREEPPAREPDSPGAVEGSEALGSGAADGSQTGEGEPSAPQRDKRLTRARIFSDPSPLRDDQPVPPVDAWRLLQRARLRQIEPNPEDAKQPEGGAPGPDDASGTEGAATEKETSDAEESAPDSSDERSAARTVNMRAAESVDRPRRTALPAREPAAAADALRSVGLDHVVSVDPIGLTRYAKTNPTSINRYAKTNPTAGTEAYAQPGTGGLEVVSFVGRAPQHEFELQPESGETGSTPRRPVIAFVDTGCGDHDWLPDRTDPPQSDPWVWRRVPAPKPTRAGNTIVGVDEESTNPELYGDQSGPRDGFLDGASGHGTFVAGILRQASPDANLIAIRVADSDGTVLESELIDALEELARLIDGGQKVDVLNLSLGYYHETPEDGRFSTRLYDVLRDLRTRKVIVVCSAGNDATDRPTFPAALWNWPGSDLNVGGDEPADIADHISVGALNPNGRSVALYSNIGDWVSDYAPGTSVLSTTPPLRGGVQASSRMDLYERRRMTIDADDFTGGFAIWSGTSFSAPYLAGLIAQELAPGLTAGQNPPADAVAEAVKKLRKNDFSETKRFDDNGKEIAVKAQNPTS
jgi:hypothetical protein